MTEQTEVVTEAPKRKQARKPQKRVVKAKDAPIAGGEFAGISASSCCAACTPNRCVISTVAVCKHPYKTSDSGCGPLTMKNRLRVRKLLKHQMIDLTEG